jgi:hypothetical protein
MLMELIPNQDRFNEVLRAGRGLIHNDFSGKGASGRQYNVLHVARCPWLARSNLSVHKYFFEELREAIDWLTRERGAEGQALKRCGSCRADAGVQSKLRTVATGPTPELARPRSIEPSRASFDVRLAANGVRPRGGFS